MPGNFKNEDIRVIKTQKAILDALPKKLRYRKFSRITVNDLCEEAQISRTAFYTHFQDKYSLLEFWLRKIKLKSIHQNYITQIEIFTKYIKDNLYVARNLLEEANEETIGILHKFILFFLDIPEQRVNGKLTDEYIALSNFCAGAIYNYMLWQIRNKLVTDLKVVNEYIVFLVNRLFDNDR